MNFSKELLLTGNGNVTFLEFILLIPFDVGDPEEVCAVLGLHCARDIRL